MNDKLKKFLFCALSVFFCSCMNSISNGDSEGKGTLKIYVSPGFEGYSERTAGPSSDISMDDYEFTFSKGGASETSCNVENSKLVISVPGFFSSTSQEINFRLYMYRKPKAADSKPVATCDFTVVVPPETYKINYGTLNMVSDKTGVAYSDENGSVKLYLKVPDNISVMDCNVAGTTCIKNGNIFYIENSTLASGTYDFLFNLKDSAGSVIHHWQETVFVYSGIETNTWISGKVVSEGGNAVKDISDIINTTVYVCGTQTADSWYETNFPEIAEKASKSGYEGNGSLASPFTSLPQAVRYIQKINDGQKEYTIFTSGTFSVPSAIPTNSNGTDRCGYFGFVEIDPYIGGNSTAWDNFNLTIKGLGEKTVIDGDDRYKCMFIGSFENRTGYRTNCNPTKIKVHLENINFKNGFSENASSSDREDKRGGGLVVFSDDTIDAEYRTKVYVKNCSFTDCSSVWEWEASALFSNYSDVYLEDVECSGSKVYESVDNRTEKDAKFSKDIIMDCESTCTVRGKIAGDIVLRADEKKSLLFVDGPVDEGSKILFGIKNVDGLIPYDAYIASADPVYLFKGTDEHSLSSSDLSCFKIMATSASDSHEGESLKYKLKLTASGAVVVKSGITSEIVLPPAAEFKLNQYCVDFGEETTLKASLVSGNGVNERFGKVTEIKLLQNSTEIKSQTYTGSDRQQTFVTPSWLPEDNYFLYVKGTLDDVTYDDTLILSVSIDFLNEPPEEGRIRVGSEKNLEKLRTWVNGGSKFDPSKVEFALEGDIELTEPWIPMGNTEANYFSGVFNGNGHRISGLTITGSTNAFFNYFYRFDGNYNKTSEIKNLTLEGTSEGSGFVSRGVGFTIENCVSRVNINSTSSAAGFGRDVQSCDIRNCVNYGNVTGYSAGGIVESHASNVVTINSCINYGNIKNTSISSYYGAGGISASSYGTIRNCANYGIITSVNNVAGGIAGLAYISNNSRSSGGIYNCANYGEIKGKTGAGGILGVVYNSTGKLIRIENCYSTGKVYSQTSDSAGGVVGYLKLTGNAIFNNYYLAGCLYESDVSVTDVNWGASGDGTVTVIDGYIDSRSFNPDLSFSSSVEVNGTTCTTVLEALNQWVNQVSSSTYRLWEAKDGKLYLKQ